MARYSYSFFSRILGTLLLLQLVSFAQTTGELATSQTSASSSAPLVLTFQDAIARAQKNMPQFLSVKTEFGLAHQDKVQARAALLRTRAITSIAPIRCGAPRDNPVIQ